MNFQESRIGVGHGGLLFPTLMRSPNRNGSSMNVDRIRWHVIFHGIVQGVGFRQTCCEQSCLYGIQGWVRNLDNGTVEMIAEASESDLKHFVQAVESNTLGSVEERNIQSQPASGEFNSFQVRR